MQKKFKVFFYFLFITFLLILMFMQPPFKKNILILTSYHRGYEWNDIIEQGFLSILKNYGEYINIKIEYMDVLNNNDEIYYDKLLTLYKYKYKNSKFDMVICSDNSAYDFFQEHRDELFPSTPLIFTGLNNFESYKSQDKLIENSTGVLESIDIKSNIDLILTLHPDTKNIFIILDNTIIGTELSTDLK